MRRLWRTSLFWLNAVLCLAAIAMMARSYRVCDELSFTRSWQGTSPGINQNPTAYVALYHVVSSWGRVELGHELGESNRPDDLETPDSGWRLDWARFPAEQYKPGRRGSWVDWAGFFAWSAWSEELSFAVSGRHESGVVFPWWLMVVLLGIWPVVRVRKALGRNRRRSLGLCLTCGYDLRASPERCPECGTAVPVDLVRRPIA